MIRIDRLLRTAVAVAAIALPTQALAEAPAKAAASEKKGRDPETLFRTTGCRGCHGKGAPFHKNIVAAQSKELKEIAAWILTPQKFKPGVQMPNYKGIITDAEAEELAKWIKAGNPK